MNLAPAPRTATCHHPPELREQTYPHGWRCNGCCRFFFGLVTDAEPQTLAPRDRETAAEHNRLKRLVADQMLAKGLTPPRATP